MATEEKKRKVLIAVDLSNWAEEAFKCKRIVFRSLLVGAVVELRAASVRVVEI